MKYLLLNALIFAFAQTVFADLKSNFDPLLRRHGISKDQISMTVLKLKPNDKWASFFEVNPEVLRTPASLTKILTAIASFDVIPSQHQFMTELKADSLPTGDAIEGSIYLVGSGDPTLVTENLWLLIHDLKRLGVTKIKGDLVYDTSIFDEVKFSKSRSTTNHRAYSSPTSGLTFNWNSLWVRVLPRKVGQPARVYVDPPDDSIVIRSTAKTTSGRTRIAVDRKTLDGVDHIIVSGSVKAGDEFSVYRSHTLPAQRAAIQAVNFLKQEGIEVVGKIKEGKAPATAVQIAKTKSVIIDEVVKQMMKYSNNLISEMLIKYIDHQENSRPGTLSGGLGVMNNVLKKYSQKPFTIVNPSGLTIQNKLSTDFLTELLTAMRSHPKHDAEFLASFPRAGIDGTIKNRMKKAAGQIRAKTGLLNGVVGLSGYIHSNLGNTYAFAFIYNGPTKRQGRATDLFDLMAERIALQN